jgi:dihydrofolate reductase
MPRSDRWRARLQQTATATPADPLSRVLARDEICGPGGKELFEAFERSPLIREMFFQSLPVELDVPADELRAACLEDRERSPLKAFPGLRARRPPMR